MKNTASKSPSPSPSKKKKAYTNAYKNALNDIGKNSKSKTVEKKEGKMAGKKEGRNILAIRLVAFILSGATIVFALIGFYNPDNWFVKVAMQASLGLLMLLNGTEALVLKRRKVLGASLIGVAAFVLCVMIYTVYVGVTTKAF